MSKHLVTIRKAELSHAKCLSSLRKQVREETYRGIYADEMLDQYDIFENELDFRKQIASEGNDLFLVYLGEELVGYFGVGKPIYWYPDCSDHNELFLNALYIIKSYCRKGIGRTVMSFVYQLGRESGKKKFYNNCNLHNTNAIAFYLACGGEIVFWENGHTNRAEDQMTFEHTIV